jgi:Fe-S-cluster containining protein
MMDVFTIRASLELRVGIIYGSAISLLMQKLPNRDRELIQIVDAALAETTRKSGNWLVCKKGCTPCCHGIFAINQLDAARLTTGLSELLRREPERAAAVKERAIDAWDSLSAKFPGDTSKGILTKSAKEFDKFADKVGDMPCPVLDPDTGACDLYAQRPMTCRVFGPPVRSGEGGGIGVCELCYNGVTDKEIAACEMVPDPDNLEDKLNEEVESEIGLQGDTIIAFRLSH